MLHEKYWAQGLRKPFWILRYPCPSPPAHEVVLHALTHDSMTAVGQVNRKPIFPQISAQPLRLEDPGQPHPKRRAIANSRLPACGWQRVEETGTARVKRKTKLG